MMLVAIEVLTRIATSSIFTISLIKVAGLVLNVMLSIIIMALVRRLAVWE